MGQEGREMSQQGIVCQISLRNFMMNNFRNTIFKGNTFMLEFKMEFWFGSMKLRKDASRIMSEMLQGSQGLTANKVGSF